MIGINERAMKASSGFHDFFASPDGLQTLSSIKDQCKDAQVLSFDVFDTVLWRDSKSELERFWDIAKRFHETLTTENALTRSNISVPEVRTLLVTRIYSASHVYQLSERISNTTEGRLQDIAQNMMVSLRFPKERRNELADLWCDTEISVESEQLVLAHPIDAIIDWAIDLDKRVIFVSDMYLEGWRINHLLEIAGCRMQRIEKLVSTADTRINKRTGTIFPVLADELKTESSKIIHFGDSLSSDFQRPKAAGWKSIYLPVPRCVQKQRFESHQTALATILGDVNLPLPMSCPSID